MAKSTVLINPESGTIDRIFACGKILKNIGTKHNQGYLFLMVNGERKLSHRVIWESVHGQIPKSLQIDHINGVKCDNRISNLRLVTSSQNNQNKKHCRAGNVSGIKGVTLDKKTGHWRAVITNNGKRKQLGTYVTLEEADEVYSLAASMLHTHNPCAA